MQTKRARIEPAEGGAAAAASGVAAGGRRNVLDRLLRVVRPACVYHMDSIEERRQLIAKLWTGEYSEDSGRFTHANPDLINLLEQQTEVDWATRDDPLPPTPRRPPQLQSKWPRFEGVLSILFRARSQKLVTLEVAALSLRFLHDRVPASVWDAVHYFSRLVMARKWTEKLCEEALELDPGPPYAVACALSAACFDNFTIRVGYGSYATIDRQGERFDMTNWASVSPFSIERR